MLYTYRLQGYEEDWQPATRSMRALYQDLPVSEYTFQVRAIDRDLNYSELARVRLKVVPDPRDRLIDELEQRVRERTRELEEKNRQIQLANQHKSQFLSRMSHDLRTPMNAIIGYTRILLRKLQDTIDERQYRNEVHPEAQGLCGGMSWSWKAAFGRKASRQHHHAVLHKPALGLTFTLR